MRGEGDPGVKHKLDPTPLSRYAQAMREHAYFVHMLASRRNGTLYVGVTNDVMRRTWEHRNDLVDGFTKKYGVPFLAEGSRGGQASRYVFLGLGKLGGHEMGYHSELDLILVYEGDGQTVPPHGSTRTSPRTPWAAPST